MQVANFIGAATDREVVFTRNATEAVNLVAHTWGLHNLQQGDEVGAGSVVDLCRALCRLVKDFLGRTV